MTDPTFIPVAKPRMQAGKWWVGLFKNADDHISTSIEWLGPYTWDEVDALHKQKIDAGEWKREAQ